MKYLTVEDDAILVDAFDIDVEVEKQLASMEWGNQLGKLQEVED